MGHGSWAQGFTSHHSPSLFEPLYRRYVASYRYPATMHPWAMGSGAHGLSLAPIALSPCFAPSTCKEFGVTIQLQHAFACDSDEAVQKFIMLNHSPDVVIADTASLGDKTTQVLNKEVVSFTVPCVDIFIAGFICKGRSKKNNTREGPTAVRERLGSTGSSFDEIAKHIETHKPRAVIQLPAASPATVPVQHARRLSVEGAWEAVLARDEQHETCNMKHDN